MFCPQCGKEAAFSARFCSSCGAALSRSAPAPRNRIERPRHGRVIAGVCLGLARHFQWDIALVRIVMLVFAILSWGTGSIVYVAAWILMPESPYALPSETGGGTAV